MRWVIAENQLDVQQRTFVQGNAIDSGCHWIKGFPGSGKSVLLLYTLKRIKNRFPKAKIAFVVFTRSMIEMFKNAFIEAGTAADVMTMYEYLKSDQNYDFILCDEIQDMTPRILKSMKSHCEHVIVAGDENQSIYEKDPVSLERTLEPNQILSILSGTSHELSTIYRLTKDIIRCVNLLLPDMNIFEDRRDMTKQSTQVVIAECESYQAEVKHVYTHSNRAIQDGASAAILFPTRRAIIFFIQECLKQNGKNAWTARVNGYNQVDFGGLNKHLEANNLRIQYVGNGYGHFNENESLVTLMTYASAKGLDFDNVYLPGMDERWIVVPRNIMNEVYNDVMNRRMLMVAMTRSRNALRFSYSGKKHPYVELFSSICNCINTSSQQRPNTTNFLAYESST